MFLFNLILVVASIITAPTLIMLALSNPEVKEYDLLYIISAVHLLIISWFGSLVFSGRIKE